MCHISQHLTFLYLFWIIFNQIMTDPQNVIKISPTLTIQTPTSQTQSPKPHKLGHPRNNKKLSDNILDDLNSHSETIPQDHKIASSTNEVDSNSSNRIESHTTINEIRLNTHTSQLDTLNDRSALDKGEDSLIISPTKSILKRGSTREGDASPDRKKKGVAFVTMEPETTIIKAPEIHDEEEEEDEEMKLDDSFFQQTRFRSKSTEGQQREFTGNGGNPIVSGFNKEVPKNVVIRNVSVGRVQDGVAILLSEDFNVIEIPLSMLPSDVRKGNILKFTVERNIVEEEGRKDSITRIQRELLADKDLFNDYNRKLEYFKNKKMEAIQSTAQSNLNLQNVIDAVHSNLQDTSFLDRSELAYNDRVIVRSKNSR